jgi:tetratricopeptide (TPR) repeat protein
MLARILLCAVGAAVLLTSAARAQQSPEWTACIASRQDPDERIRSCAAIITAGRERGRNLAIAYNNRGDGYWDKKDLDRAIADYTQAIRTDRSYATAFVNLGMVWRDKGEIDRALANFNEAIRVNPRSAFAYNNRGLAWRQKRELDRAIADFSEAIRLDPNYTLAYQNRANGYRDKGDLDRALADYTSALGLDSTIAALYGDRGVLMFRKGDLERTIADFSEAIRIDPKFALAYQNRGNAYRAKGDFERAIIDYSDAIRLDPTSAALYGDRGYAHFFKGAFAAAISDLGHANEIAANPYRMLFRFLAQAGLGESGAAELSASAARLKSKDWPYPAIELFLGQRSVERTLGVAGNPGNLCEANFYVGEWHLLRGDRDRARQSLQLAADGCPKNFYEHAGAVAELERLNR